MSSCCAACASTQSRICCCSVRMWPTRAWMPFGKRRDRLGVALIFDRGLRALGDDRRVRNRLDNRRRLDVAGEKLLELGIEPILRLAGLEIEKAENQGTREAEQRGGERNAHAGDRRGQALLEVVEHGRRVDPGLHAVDDAGDRVDRLQQTPERAEQPEEDQEPDQIAAEFAALVEPRGDRIEDRARGDGRQASRARAGVEHHRHRREQYGGRRGAVGHGAGQRVDPVYFAEQPDNLPEGEQRADRQHAEDEAVQAGIGAEGERDLLIEDENDESDQGQERRHPHQENTRGGEQADIRILRHGSPNRTLKHNADVFVLIP